MAIPATADVGRSQSLNMAIAATTLDMTAKATPFQSHAISSTEGNIAIEGLGALFDMPASRRLFA